MGSVCLHLDNVFILFQKLKKKMFATMFQNKKKQKNPLENSTIIIPSFCVILFFSCIDTFFPQISFVSEPLRPFPPITELSLDTTLFHISGKQQKKKRGWLWRVGGVTHPLSTATLLRVFCRDLFLSLSIRSTLHSRTMLVKRNR